MCHLTSSVHVKNLSFLGKKKKPAVTANIEMIKLPRDILPPFWMLSQMFPKEGDTKMKNVTVLKL